MGRRRRGGQGQGVPADSGPAGEEDEVVTEEEPEAEVMMDDACITGLRQTMDHLKQLVRDIYPTCGSEAEREEVAEQLKTTMLDLVRTEMAHMEGLRNMARGPASLPQDTVRDELSILRACEQFEKVTLEKVSGYRTSLTNPTLMKHKAYKELCQEIQAVIDAESPDIMDVSASEKFPCLGNTSVADLENETGVAEFIPILDPITKQPLTDPVRNKICRHIYGKAAILGLIKKNSKFRCPTQGCSNRSFVKPDDLITDLKLTSKVRQKVKEAQKGHCESDSD